MKLDSVEDTDVDVTADEGAATGSVANDVEADAEYKEDACDADGIQYEEDKGYAQSSEAEETSHFPWGGGTLAAATCVRGHASPKGHESTRCRRHNSAAVPVR